MCLLLFQDLDVHKPIKKEDFEKIWSKNPHGGGVGYYRGHEPVIYASMLKDQTWSNYERAVDEINAYKGGRNRLKGLILHCRVATGGSPKVMSNNHPFFVPAGTGMLLAHNGVTAHHGIVRPEGWSDTRTLATCWIPEFAKEFLTNAVDMSKVEEQIKPSRLCILTQWTHRLLGFPYQMEEWKQYGMFSNYIWDVKEVKNGYYSYSPPSWKKIYDNDPEQHKRDYDRLKRDKDARFLSANMAARVFYYAILNNLSLGSTLLLLKKLFGDFPSVNQMKEFTDHFAPTLDAISRFQEDPIPTDWEEIWEQEFYEDKDELLFRWMEENGIETEDPNAWEDPKHPQVSQMDIEMARANEPGVWSEEMGEFVREHEPERCLCQDVERTPEDNLQYPIDEQFPFEEPKQNETREHEQPVLTFGTPQP